MARQARSEATRKKIVDAAVDLFAEVGYQATGLGDIIERAELTKGALYYHFDSKEALATAIIEEGPFSDYTGYERLQVVTKGAGLVLVAPDHEIDLRLPMHPRRYDGGTPIRTLLEKGPVEVVNLIADRGRFDIDLRVGKAGAQMFCKSGRHVGHGATR